MLLHTPTPCAFSIQSQDKMGGACSMYEMRNAYKIFIRKPQGKRQLGRLKT